MYSPLGAVRGLLRLPPRVEAFLRWLATYAYEIVAFGLPFVIFAASESHDLATWDTAEYQGVPYILGIGHPTGFPLYTIVGFAWSHIVAISTVAYRMNLFSGVCGAAACLACYLICREFKAPRPIALICSLWFAVCNPVWIQASRADVAEFVLALTAFSILYTLRWMATRNAMFLYVAVLFSGLTLATHAIAIWLLPGIIVAIVLRRDAVSAGMLGKAALIVCACVCLYAYLPVRSEIIDFLHQDPTAVLVGLHGGVLINYNDPATWSGFTAEISGSQFGAGHSALVSLNPLKFDSMLWNLFTLVKSSFGVYGLALAFLGASIAWRTNRDTTVVLVLMCLGAVPFSYSYAMLSDPDKYRLYSLLLVAVLAACTAIGTVRSRWGNVRVVVLGAFMFSFAFSTFRNDSPTFAYSGRAGGDGFIRMVAPNVPTGSTLVAPWLDATSAAYGAFVDGALAGRRIVSGDAQEDARFYPEWLKVGPIYLVQPPTASTTGINVVYLKQLDATHVLYRVLPVL